MGSLQGARGRGSGRGKSLRVLDLHRFVCS